MPTRYYALIGNDRTADDPYSVFRHVGSDWQLWDRAAKRWKTEVSLASYVMDGELGAVEITKGAANRVIKKQAVSEV
jgi:hypothetical protein